MGYEYTLQKRKTIEDLIAEDARSPIPTQGSTGTLYSRLEYVK